MSVAGVLTPGDERLAESLAESRAEAAERATTLSSAEQEVLRECEAVLRQNRKAFYRTGAALAKIRDDRLYRATHSTFEVYCRDIWDFSKSYANYQIVACEIVGTLIDNNCCHLPQTESQARPLTKIDSDDLVAVWQKVLDQAPQRADGTPKITAKLVKEVVDEWLAVDEPDDDEEFDLDLAARSLQRAIELELREWPAVHHEDAAQILRAVARKRENP